jgi:iron complex outermembrane receptor protein
MVYASAAEGVKNGGFNGIGTTQFKYLTSQQVYQPEKNWTYELGTKNSFFNGRVVLDADLFYVKWTDMQIEEQPSNTPAALAASTSVITTNLGNATSYGLETNGLFKPIHHLDLTYALALINPTYDKGTIAQGYLKYCDGVACSTNDSIAGKMLGRTSKIQLTSGATWSDTLLAAYRWNLHGEFTYQSKQYADSENLAEVPSRILFNASATIRGGGPLKSDWDLTLWGRNIFDRKYVADSFVITPTYIPSFGERATFGATLNLHY